MTKQNKRLAAKHFSAVPPLALYYHVYAKKKLKSCRKTPESFALKRFH
jgi:hypothetical protein